MVSLRWKGAFSKCIFPASAFVRSSKSLVMVRRCLLAVSMPVRYSMSWGRWLALSSTSESPSTPCTGALSSWMICAKSWFRKALARSNSDFWSCKIWFSSAICWFLASKNSLAKEAMRPACLVCKASWASWVMSSIIQNIFSSPWAVCLVKVKFRIRLAMLSQLIWSWGMSKSSCKCSTVLSKPSKKGTSWKIIRPK